MSEKHKEFFEDMEKKLRGLGNKMNSMFEDFVQRADKNQNDLDVTADSFKKGEDLMFELDLPGFKKEDVKIQVLDNQLIVRGKREKSSDSQEGKYKFQERAFGFFERSFSLPPYAMAEKTKAKFDNGVLTISIPLDEYEIEEQEIVIE